MDEAGKVKAQSRFIAGIADYDKEGAADAYLFGRSIDHRANSREIKLLPKTSKESGNTINGLPLWADRVADTTYIYDELGNIYTRSLAGSYALVRSVANSTGNGLRYYGEDDFLYYTTTSTIGRYGQVTNVNATPTYTDDFLGAEGGIPANTHSLDLESGSSHYADANDSSSLSITGNLAIEAYVKPESLPTVGNSMTLVGKWDESGTTKSYKLEIKTVAGYFADGTDGSLTVSSNTTQSPKDATCTGTSGVTSLTFASSSGTFAIGEVILIHQTRGTGAGTWMRTKISGVSGTTSGTLTLEDPLNANYTTGAQVLVLKQHTDVTIDAGITYSAKAWDGSKGGILAFICSGTLTVNGTLSAGTATAGDGFSTANQGFRGATTDGAQGEGTAGDRNTVSLSANGNGGGGGAGTTGGAGGGGHGSAGSNGAGTGGSGGSASGSSDLTTLTFGGGGGRGAGIGQGEGGYGGGIVFAIANTLTVNPSTGFIKANGSDGQVGSSPSGCGGGGGAGGSIFLKYQTGTLGTDRLSARGGNGGVTGDGLGNGGNGANGRIHIDYSTTTTGSSTYPSLTATLDGSLVSATTSQWRLGISDDGTGEEYLTKNAMALVTGSWIRIAVSWTASTSTAIFYENAQLLGTVTGTKTAIHNNASLLYIGANKVSAVQNFFDGKIDDIRIWNTTRSAGDLSTYKDRELVGTEAGLVAYYQLDNAATDSTGNTNDLTLRNSPTYSTDVPFSAATTRLDIDQSLDTSGNTYTLGVAISENVAHRQTFVPAKDPQKSIGINIGTKGTGDWTLVVHDALNRLVASKTVVNASLPSSGAYEFIFDTTWTPVIGASYHFHLYSTVADGTVVTTTSNDLETAEFFTYYQFLVNSNFHPIENMLNFLAIANGRYLATYNAAAGYNPHRLVLPAGWNIRCLTLWRDFIVMGCTKGDNIYSYDQGLLVFWDGSSTTYNDYRFIPEGAINAMLGAQGNLWIIAGYLGDLLKYTGGDSAEKVKRIPKVTEGQYLEVMPGAMTMWKTLLRVGYAGTSDSEDIERGVYSYGRLNTEHPLSFSFDYPISTGNRTATNIKVGLVFPVDRKLLIGWKDNTAYGVDVVNPAGNPYANGTIEGFITDAGGLWKEKMTPFVRAEFKPLRAGESIVVKYKLDRATDWTTQTEDTVGATTVKLPIAKGRHREFQRAVDLATTGSTSPTLLEFSVKQDPMIGEQSY